MLPEFILKGAAKQGHDEDLKLFNAAKPITNTLLHDLTVTRHRAAVRSNMSHGATVAFCLGQSKILQLLAQDLDRIVVRSERGNSKVKCRNEGSNHEIHADIPVLYMHHFKP